jgi:heat shock protein HspQ
MIDIDNSFQNYIREIYELIEQNNAREESFYHILKNGNYST